MLFYFSRTGTSKSYSVRQRTTISHYFSLRWQVQALAPQTELDNGSGVQTVDGPFALNLASYSEQSQADAARLRASQAGLAASVEPVTVDGEQWYRLVVTGLASFDGARSLGSELQAQFGYSSPWVSGG